MDATDTTAHEAAKLQGLTQRVAAIEAVLRLVPVVLAALFVIPSLFLPFVTYEIEDREVTPSLLTMPFDSFSAASDANAGSSGAAISIAFGVAFLLLLLVAITSVIAIAPIAGNSLSGRADGFATLMVVLLVVGAVCAWLVVATGVAGDDAWVLGPGLPLLTVGALIAALVTLVPVYRSLWSR
jgi:hypothetical protein